MKVKPTTFLLDILFLWGSLSTYGQPVYSPNSHQIKTATENVTVGIAPTLTLAEHELTGFPLAILTNCTHAKAYAVQRIRSA